MIRKVFSIPVVVLTRHGLSALMLLMDNLKDIIGFIVNLSLHALYWLFPASSRSRETTQRLNLNSTNHRIIGVGPGLGAILAAAFYKLMKYLEYEAANPDQDADFGPEENLREAQPGTDASHRHSDTSTLSPMNQ